MRSRIGILAFLSFSALILATGGCGTRPLGSGGGASSGTSVPFTLAVTDQPPSGVTILSFTITVTGAVLATEFAVAPVEVVLEDEEEQPANRRATPIIAAVVTRRI